MWTADNRHWSLQLRQTVVYPSPDRCGMGAYRAADPGPGKPGGGKRRVAIREVINGVIVRILSIGCQWLRARPSDLPPRSTVA